MEKIVDELFSKFHEFMHKKNFLICFVLGKHSQQFGFDQYVINAETFNKIKNKLESYKKWDEKTIEKSYAKVLPVVKYSEFIIEYKTLPFDNLVYLTDVEEYEETVTNIKCQIYHIYKRKNIRYILVKELLDNNVERFFISLELEVNEGCDVKYSIHSLILKNLDLNSFIEKNVEDNIIYNIF